MPAHSLFQELCQIYQPGPHTGEPQLFTEEVNIDGWRLYLTGISASGMNGTPLTGSAAAEGEWPVRRAFFEYLERSAIMAAAASEQGFAAIGEEGRHFAGAEVFPVSDTPSEWQYSKSNGVAIGPDAEAACAAARFELLERDAILRAWAGETRPRPVANPEIALPLLQRYEVRTVVFEQPGAKASVAGVFALPCQDSIPVAFGFGARDTEAAAVAAARSEMLQRLGFLWGEVAEEEPAFSPSPLFHQEKYLHRRGVDTLVAWLEGGHRRFGATSGASKIYDITYADITPAWLQGRCRVVRAISGDCRNLTFGRAPDLTGLPPELRIHPIA